MAREGLSGKVTFEQRPEEGPGRRLQEEGTGSVKPKGRSVPGFKEQQGQWLGWEELG